MMWCGLTNQPEIFYVYLYLVFGLRYTGLASVFSESNLQHLAAAGAGCRQRTAAAAGK